MIRTPHYKLADPEQPIVGRNIRPEVFLKALLAPCPLRPHGTLPAVELLAGQDCKKAKSA